MLHVRPAAHRHSSSPAIVCFDSVTKVECSSETLQCSNNLALSGTMMDTVGCSSSHMMMVEPYTGPRVFSCRDTICIVLSFQSTLNRLNDLCQRVLRSHFGFCSGFPRNFCFSFRTGVTTVLWWIKTTRPVSFVPKDMMHVGNILCGGK